MYCFVKGCDKGIFEVYGEEEMGRRWNWNY
jgi:hypothetical protein